MATRRRKKSSPPVPMAMSFCSFKQPVQLGGQSIKSFHKESMPNVKAIYLSGSGVTLTDTISGATVHVPPENVGATGYDLGSITSSGYIPPA